MSKTKAFLLTFLTMAVFGGVAIWWPEKGEHVAGIMTAIGGMGTFYIGLQVANNGVKGKYWNQNVYDAEHNGNDTHKETKSNG